MAQTETQRRASRAVARWLAHREANTAWLVRQTGSDPGTIGDFLNGNRWPKFKTQGRIEKALSWPAGTLTAIADGADAPDPDVNQPENVGGDTHDPEDNELLYRRPDNLSDAEWERVKAESRGFIEWQIEKASRER
ncbi:hypothetical protein [Nocardioides sp. InS609-2]|uniref:hypothetical protein n=1 Tax=Nocardioides sp. InS609-2 TaxID=2760705 RepID=UPI0020C04CF7|nr:hypothetical protein [Nocardioides sp. InS609-2]